MELEIVDWSSRERVERDGLLEFHTYGLKLSARRVLFLGCELQLVEGCWLIETPFAVGEAQIEWWDDHKRYQLDVYIGADPQKIDERHQWEQMLSDIAHWKGSLIGKTGVRLGSVLFGSGYNVLCVEAVYSLLLRLCHQLEHIEDWLPSILAENVINLQRALPSQFTRNQADPIIQQWLTASEYPPMYREVSNQYDVFVHSDIRQLRLWTEQVLSVVEATIDVLKGPVVDSWRNQRARSLEMIRERLVVALLQPPLYPSMHEKSTDSTVEYNHISPSMAQIGQLVYQISSPKFSIHQGEFPVSGRHSFGIYEIWCFHKLIDVCTSLLQVRPHFLDEEPLEWGGAVQWDSDAGVMTLHYNLRFVAYWEREAGSGHPFSLVGEQRPDFVLQHENRWLVLDAKYRSTRVNVLDAFSSAFSYLTSLRMPHINSEPEGCFLLVPKSLPESHHWFETDFHQNHKFGLLCCSTSDYKDVEENVAHFLLGSCKP